ncbi:hypothetical protein H257_15145 [Aphanomyces astaci]|uniref:Uncharacterized protein n=1 Tax=Aphanomyces astaci TaxID=112090 RepID=W4FNF8_APHAT|nr:hypothetical protein H257_15145 [Aphanomyces astaci]ETV68995.1 hypothetical protein H257_15145 [Aphanomyces astaci]|eukprot:XP_009841454.1 hypothetical protein H257_15145 [Aphanomyces astaci]
MSGMTSAMVKDGTTGVDRGFGTCWRIAAGLAAPLDFIALWRLAARSSHRRLVAYTFCKALALARWCSHKRWSDPSRLNVRRLVHVLYTYLHVWSVVALVNEVVLVLLRGTLVVDG